MSLRGARRAYARAWDALLYADRRVCACRVCVLSTRVRDASELQRQGWRFELVAGVVVWTCGDCAGDDVPDERTAHYLEELAATSCGFSQWEPT